MPEPHIQNVVLSLLKMESDCQGFLLKYYLIFRGGGLIITFENKYPGEGGDQSMKKAISVILSVFVIGILIAALTGCGADIKAENEKLKAENTNLKSDNDKLKLEVQKLKEEIQKGAEKEATISSLNAENQALKKQVEDLKSQMTKKKK